MTGAQAECIRALKAWGWGHAKPLGRHYIVGYFKTPVDGSLVAWCAPALLAHVKDPSKAADLCSRHPRDEAA